MAITTTLSRLKNYFIGWHTANYRTLHEFTDRITDEEPDGSKLVESKTIFQYINDIITPIKEKVDDLDDNIGIRCIPRHGDTLWENICGLWSTIGEWASPNDPDLESFWKLERTDNSDWNPVWENGVLTDNWPKGWTVKGWIRKIWYEILKVQSPRISDLETQMRYLQQVCTMHTKKSMTGQNHSIAFYRKGYYVYVRGWIVTKSDGREYEDEGEIANRIYPISASIDSGKTKATSGWAPFVPTSSVYLNFNNRFGSSSDTKTRNLNHRHFIDEKTTYGTSGINNAHSHNWGKRWTVLCNESRKGVDDTEYSSYNLEHSHSNATGINSIQINVGAKMKDDPDIPGTTEQQKYDNGMFSLVVTGHNLNHRTIWFTGTYLARYREHDYGDKSYGRDDFNGNIHEIGFNIDFPNVGQAEGGNNKQFRV